MKKMQKLKKLTAVLMAVLMIAVSVPVAFAADGDTYTLELVELPVASKIEPGQRLKESIITGGAIKVIETGEIFSGSDIIWVWPQGMRPISAPGTYQAKGSVIKYNVALLVDIYVGFVGGSADTEITVEPIIPEIYYDGVTTWEDIRLEGGVAVEKGTDNVVDGIFTLSPAFGYATSIITPGEKEVTVKFIPNDTETYASAYMEVTTITVNKGIPTWKDGITPIVTHTYGTRVNDETFNYLGHDGSIVADERFSFRLCDAEGNYLEDGVFLDCGTYYDYQLSASSSQYSSSKSNWQTTLLPVTIVVEPGEAEITVSYNSFTNKLIVSGTSVYLYGTFDIYIDGELAFDDAPLERYIDTQRFETDWMPADISENSTHDIKVIYNKADNDNVFIASDFEGSFTFEARRNITTGEKSIHFYKNSSGFTPGITALFAGDEITANAGLSSFRYWKITDSKGNDVDLEFVKGDMNSSEIIFVMPEFDINVDYVTQADIDRQEAIDNCDCLCHNDNPIVQFFWRIILFFMNLFKVENVCDCGYPHGS